jgi:hypothetical protein
MTLCLEETILASNRWDPDAAPNFARLIQLQDHWGRPLFAHLGGNAKRLPELANFVPDQPTKSGRV